MNIAPKRFNYKYTVTDIVWNIAPNADATGLNSIEIFYSDKLYGKKRIEKFLNWGRENNGITAAKFSWVREPSDV
jgi:hypothetical protein